MLALRPQARFGGQPGRKARLLGRRSSRGLCGGARFRGRIWNPPLRAEDPPAANRKPNPAVHPV